MPGFDGRGPIKGYGKGFGPCGRARCWYPVMGDEKEILEKELEEIKKRLKELE